VELELELEAVSVLEVLARVVVAVLLPLDSFLVFPLPPVLKAVDLTLVPPQVVPLVVGYSVEVLWEGEVSILVRVGEEV
jgi:hypothetical protein